MKLDQKQGKYMQLKMIKNKISLIKIKINFIKQQFLNRIK